MAACGPRNLSIQLHAQMIAGGFLPQARLPCTWKSVLVFQDEKEVHQQAVIMATRERNTAAE